MYIYIYSNNTIQLTYTHTTHHPHEQFTFHPLYYQTRTPQYIATTVISQLQYHTIHISVLPITTHTHLPVNDLVNTTTLHSQPHTYSFWTHIHTILCFIHVCVCTPHFKITHTTTHCALKDIIYAHDAHTNNCWHTTLTYDCYIQQLTTQHNHTHHNNNILYNTCLFSCHWFWLVDYVCITHAHQHNTQQHCHINTPHTLTPHNMYQLLSNEPKHTTNTLFITHTQWWLNNVWQLNFQHHIITHTIHIVCLPHTIILFVKYTLCHISHTHQHINISLTTLNNTKHTYCTSLHIQYHITPTLKHTTIILIMLCVACFTDKLNIHVHTQLGSHKHFCVSLTHNTLCRPHTHTIIHWHYIHHVPDNMYTCCTHTHHTPNHNNIHTNYVCDCVHTNATHTHTTTPHIH